MGDPNARLFSGGFQAEDQNLAKHFLGGRPGQTGLTRFAAG